VATGNLIAIVTSSEIAIARVAMTSIEVIWDLNVNSSDEI